MRYEKTTFNEGAAPGLTATELNKIGQGIEDAFTAIDEIEIPDASASVKGIVKLVDSVSSSSVVDAATPKSVKTVNDTVTAHLAEQATETKLGHVKLSDLPKGKRTTRFVIGTSTAGWTASDVDYLCNGTNDQVAINAAITALPATGGEIVILDGTYNITGKISVNKRNVSLRGNGDSTVLKRMWNSSVAEGVINLESGTEKCKITGICVDGNKSTHTSSNNRGIYLASSSSNNTITGNTFINSIFGILTSSSSNNNTITGNTCNNNDTGIAISSSSNNTITGNMCYNNNIHGIYLTSSSSNNTITGNTCNNNDNGIYLASSSNNNTITGNTCNNNNIRGIYLTSSSNNTITGNTFIRGTGLTSNYTTSQYTIHLDLTGNNYNLISSNNCMGKDVVIGGGTSNTSVNNKFS